MTYWPLATARRYLDLPHNDDRTGYLPGLAHRTCNRRDGQRKTSAILRAKGYRLTPQQRIAIRVKQAKAAANATVTTPANARLTTAMPMRDSPARWLRAATTSRIAGSDHPPGHQ
jgi:hypothetical protein